MHCPKRPCHDPSEEEARRAIKRRCCEAFRLAFEDQRGETKRAAETLDRGPAKRRALAESSSSPPRERSAAAQSFLDGVAFAERNIVPRAVERAVEHELAFFRSALETQRAAFRAAYDREVQALYIRISEPARGLQNWLS